MDASELAVEETGAAIKAVLGVGIEEAFLCMRARSERKDEEEASWDAPKNGASDVEGLKKRKREKKRERFLLAKIPLGSSPMCTYSYYCRIKSGHRSYRVLYVYVSYHILYGITYCATLQTALDYDEP